MPMPMTLTPAPFPRKCFMQVWEVAADFGLLVERLRQHPTFIQESLAQAAETDEFTHRLLSIYRTILAEGIRQKARLGIYRSDYLLHRSNNAEDAPRLYQVELNTISAASVANGTNIARLHRDLLQRHTQLGKYYNEANLVANSTIEVVGDALAQAYRLHPLLSVSAEAKPAILFVVQGRERNVLDQRHLDFYLWEKHGILALRRTLSQVKQQARLAEDTGTLEVSGHPIAVVYYRAGYGPSDYPTEAEWEARQLLERSNAIKSPAIDVHLLGTKKVQQVLALPGVLERYVEDPLARARLRQCFTGLYGLDEDAAGLEDIVTAAICEPGRFVLKPQREGGGNNLYNDQLRLALQTMTPKQRSAYILMDKIMPPTFPTYFLRDGIIAEVSHAASELGIYSVCLSNMEGTIVLNRPAGYLVRTKYADKDEGGVAAGIACLDSLYLV